LSSDLTERARDAVHLPRQVSGGSPVDDSDLVERLRRHDADAYRLLYTRHARYLAGVVFRLLGGDQELDDVVQESFVDAVEGIGQLEQATRLRPWLVTIAVRKVNRVLLARRRRKKLASSFALVAPRSHNPAEEWSVDDLRRALDELPAELRVPWILGRVEQLELADIARACSVSVATAKRRIAAAEQFMRRWFDAR
jgi:RNA polymerase sigma-70 factor (ECF subfamily)